MLARVVRPDGKEVSFAYDALGRRIRKTYAGTTTHFVWDGNVPLHEWTEENEVVTWLFEQDTFVPAAKPVANSGRSTITSGYFATPFQACDKTGNKVWEQELDIYGRQRERPSAFIPFKYQGQYEDAETGLYYNRFRYYDPSTGGYISQDPIGLEGGNPTMYSYVQDINNRLDIFGLAHSAVWSHMRGGVRINSGSVKSGCDVKPERRLTFPEQLETHTERKILTQLEGKVQRGDVILIKGTRPPCNPEHRGCQHAMQQFAENNSVKIIYSDGKNKWKFEGQH